MRVYLVAVLVALAVYVCGQEHCSEHHHCHQHGHNNCGGNTNVVCHQGTCECTDGGATGQNCSQVSDCTCPSDAHHDHDAHCVNNICHCHPPQPQGGHAGP